MGSHEADRSEARSARLPPSPRGYEAGLRRSASLRLKAAWQRARDAVARVRRAASAAVVLVDGAVGIDVSGGAQERGALAGGPGGAGDPEAWQAADLEAQQLQQRGAPTGVPTGAPTSPAPPHVRGADSSSRSAASSSQAWSRLGRTSTLSRSTHQVSDDGEEGGVGGSSSAATWSEPRLSAATTTAATADVNQTRLAGAALADSEPRAAAFKAHARALRTLGGDACMSDTGFVTFRTLGAAAIAATLLLEHCPHHMQAGRSQCSRCMRAGLRRTRRQGGASATIAWEPV